MFYEGQNRHGRRRQQQGSTLLKLKGPRTEWGDDTEHAGIARFLFDTGTHSLLRFDLVDRRGFMCFGGDHIYGIRRYPFRQVRLTLCLDYVASQRPHSMTMIATLLLSNQNQSNLKN